MTGCVTVVLELGTGGSAGATAGLRLGIAVILDDGEDEDTVMGERTFVLAAELGTMPDLSNTIQTN